MASYNFVWQHPAEEVWVTGTFDNWSKSIKLDKIGDSFEKTVSLPHTDKILYKFVADDTWIYNHSLQTETDHEGNINNVLYVHDLNPSSDLIKDSVISSVAPGATTTHLAGQVPLQPTSEAPGAFPETPGEGDDQTVSVNPIPPSSGIGNPITLAPGEKVPDPSTINDNTVTSAVHDDPELKSTQDTPEQTLGVAPIPATGGIGNPINLQPGEKVPDPSTITGNTVDSTVKLDKESYEKSDASAPVVDPSSTSVPTAGTGAGLFRSGPQLTNIIPESSLPMGEKATSADDNVGPTISSVAPGSTTTQLAGQVPLEPREEKKKKKESTTSGTTIAGGFAALGATAAGAALAANEFFRGKTGVDAKSQLPESVQQQIEQTAEGTTGTAPVGETAPGVPETVTESQKEASQPPEAASNAEAVAEKSKVEEQLLSEVKTTDGETATSAPAPVTTAAVGETAPGVPQEVTESQKEASEPPEAASNAEAVAEKSAVEKELLSEVKTTDAQGEPAPTATAATTTTAPTATTKVDNDPLSPENITQAAAAGTTVAAATTATTATTTSELPAGPSPPQLSATGAPQIGHPTGGGLPPIDMSEKSTMNADKDAPALPTTQAYSSVSGDVSPHTKSPSTTEQTQPTVTTGVKTGTSEAQQGPSTPTPGHNKRHSIVDRFRGGSPFTPESASSPKPPGTAGSMAESKREKRRSLFGRIKDKLKEEFSSDHKEKEKH